MEPFHTTLLDGGIIDLPLTFFLTARFISRTGACVQQHYGRIGGCLALQITQRQAAQG
jgi:hypothetical protein